MAPEHLQGVHPGYGGRNEVGPGDHHASGVAKGYGGEQSFDHTPDGPSVETGYGGDRHDRLGERMRRQEERDAEQPVDPDEPLGN